MSEAIEIANSNPSQPLQVLEVGCGPQFKWANYCGGLLFQSNVEYTGIDPGMEFMGPAIQGGEAEAIAADCKDMPFEDRTFDVVMMRSFFGQFTVSRLLHGLHGATTTGLMETYRVLKPGGEIVVAEENTPWDARAVEEFLSHRGFRVTAFEYMSEFHWTEVNPDSPWLKLRRKYYNDNPTQESKWSSAGGSPPYIMTGVKPEGAEEVRRVVHLGIDRETKQDIFTDREYVQGQPVAIKPFTKERFIPSYA